LELSASDVPNHYSANEPNSEVKNFYYSYGYFLYAYYGFHDVFSLDDKWCSPLYKGLNQATIIVSVEN
jgi:hypothetical protein